MLYTLTYDHITIARNCKDAADFVSWLIKAGLLEVQNEPFKSDSDKSAQGR